MIHNWNKIVENAISTTVALIVVSAGAIVWKAAMSVDQKIDDALEGINLQGEAIKIAVNEIEGKLIDLNSKFENHAHMQKDIIQEIDPVTGEVHYEEPKHPEPELNEPYEPGFIQQQLPADYNIPRGMKK